MEIAIIGTGVTKFGHHWDKDHDDLLVEAVNEALANANLEMKDIEAVWCGTFYPSTGISGNVFSDSLKFFGKPISRVENYCATGMDNVRNACFAVASGAYDIVIAAGVEKLIDAGSRGLPPIEGIFSVAMPVVSAPGMFAMAANRAFKDWGWNREDLALVAVKNHYNGAKHPKAHFRREVSIEEVLKAPIVAYPLGVYDCSAVSDGAAAVVLTRPEIARKLGCDYAVIKAIGMAVETMHPWHRPSESFLSFPATVKAAKMAYKMAGIEDPRKQLDFGIVHDCFTITELINYQDMGLCKPGEGAKLIREGVTAIDGDFPINPDGGLKSFGHPIAASGVRMIVELYKQVLEKAEGLQVKNAEIGFAHNLGGPYSVATVAIVSKP
ncbi:MAG: acetyl-CoA acetyltransferase [Archaeoglobaceae archaeon]